MDQSYYANVSVRWPTSVYLNLHIQLASREKSGNHSGVCRYVPAQSSRHQANQADWQKNTFISLLFADYPDWL